MISKLEQLQDDVFSRIDSDSAFENVVVLDERLGLKDSDLSECLATNTTRGGMKGAAIIIGEVYFENEDERCPGPRLEAQMIIRCIERRLVNRGPGGSGVTLGVMTERVIGLLHDFQISDLGITMTAKRGERIFYKDGETECVVVVDASLQLEPLDKCAFPVIAGDAAAVSITCFTEGASIYYTTDGTTPSPTNGTLYVNPFAVAAGTLVRAVAFKNPTYVASSIAAQTLN